MTVTMSSTTGLPADLDEPLTVTSQGGDAEWLAYESVKAYTNVFIWSESEKKVPQPRPTSGT